MPQSAAVSQPSIELRRLRIAAVESAVEPICGATAIATSRDLVLYREDVGEIAS